MGFSVTPPQLDVAYGQPINVTLALDGDLQGLGCQGDDGWYEFGSPPSGLVLSGLNLSGIYGLQESYTMTVRLIGTNNDCSALVVYDEAFINFNYIEVPPVGIQIDKNSFSQGDNVLAVLSLTNPNFLQGLGCQGDDGVLAFVSTIPGLSINGDQLTGIATVPGTYFIRGTVSGTNQDCSEEVIYLDEYVSVYIAAKPIIQSPCGPASSKVTRLRVTDTEIEHFFQGWGEFVPPEELDIEPSPWIRLLFENCTYQSVGRTGTGGEYQAITIEAEFGRPSKEINQFFSAFRNRPIQAEVTDGNGQRFVFGDKDFPLRMLPSSGADGSRHSSKIVLEGDVPFGRIVL